VKLFQRQILCCQRPKILEMMTSSLVFCGEGVNTEMGLDCISSVIWCSSLHLSRHLVPLRSSSMSLMYGSHHCFASFIIVLHFALSKEPDRGLTISNYFIDAPRISPNGQYFRLLLNTMTTINSRIRSHLQFGILAAPANGLI
jgi:hypothetical protein